MRVLIILAAFMVCVCISDCDNLVARIRALEYESRKREAHAICAHMFNKLDHNFWGAINTGNASSLVYTRNLNDIKDNLVIKDFVYQLVEQDHLGNVVRRVYIRGMQEMEDLLERFTLVNYDGFRPTMPLTSSLHSYRDEGDRRYVVLETPVFHFLKRKGQGNTRMDGGMNYIHCEELGANGQFRFTQAILTKEFEDVIGLLP